MDKIGRKVIDAVTLHLARWAIGAVWFYQGFWSKVLGRTARHARVVEAAPMFTTASAHFFLLLLGWFETLISLAVVTGFQPKTTAIIEIALLIMMNTGGLLWASKIIPDPAGMVFQNFTFAMLIWICR